MSYPPSSNLDVLFWLEKIGEINTKTNKKYQPFFPNKISFSSKSNIGISTSASLLGISNGSYLVSVTLSGNSMNESSIEYSGSMLLNVLSSQTEPPTPKISNAIFDNDGTGLTVFFDSRTNQGGLSTSLTTSTTTFQCNKLFLFDGVNYEDVFCSWLDVKSIHISLGMNGMLVVWR